MKFSPVALSVGVPAMLEGLSRRDLPEGWVEVLEDGWILDGGAALLRGFSASYHGDRARFASTVDYEIAVNGRGVPDMDLELRDMSILPTLVRRGVSFAWQALHSAGPSGFLVHLTAYITAAPVLYDPEEISGNVTFCSTKDLDHTYLDVEKLEGIAVSLEMAECVDPLPTSPVDDYA